MEFSYRCLVCGNNTTLEVDATEAPAQTCEKCEGGPELTVVTVDNIDSLPQPSNPVIAEE